MYQTYENLILNTPKDWYVIQKIMSTKTIDLTNINFQAQMENKDTEFANAMKNVNKHVSDLQRTDTQHSQKMVGLS